MSLIKGMLPKGLLKVPASVVMRNKKSYCETRNDIHFREENAFISYLAVLGRDEENAYEKGTSCYVFTRIIKLKLFIAW